jgi:hypothetical protein
MLQMEEKEYLERTNGGELEVCTGDLLDGLDIDIVAYSEFVALTDEQHDKLWNETTDIGLVEMCSHCELIETGQWDAPGKSTIFYSLITNEPEKFKQELRQLIKTILES